MKTVKGSSNPDGHWGNHQWIDLKSVNNGDWVGDFWEPAENDREPWIEIILEKSKPVKKAILYEKKENIKSFELQGKSGDDWVILYKGKGIGSMLNVEFPETKIDRFRLLIKEFSDLPGIYEIILQ